MSPQREIIYTNYPYNIRPPVDNRPFFFHFFTWSQTPEVLNTLGMTWQPFGGSGYLVLIALLVLVIILSGVLILLPLVLGGKRSSSNRHGSVKTSSVFVYFALLGIAFLFVEIPLIQQWILLLGQPIYAFTVVVGVLLLMSGFGSAMAGTTWLPKRPAFGLLVLLALILPLTMPHLIDLTLGWPLWARLGAALVSLAPLGILMGLPFPLGLAWLESEFPDLTPRAWAINGCASVVASVLAAILTLSLGFTFVMLLGAGAYFGALITFQRWNV